MRYRFNPKRRIRPWAAGDEEKLNNLADHATYSGHPSHKRNPGDFGLSPPSQARLGKSLCDDVGIFRREEALELLQRGLRLGLISLLEIGGWPKQVWAVTPEGLPLEAQREADGVYHGYPLREIDPMHQEVLAAWKKACNR